MTIEGKEVESIEDDRSGIKIHTVHIKTEAAARELSKKIGSYFTLSLPCQVHELKEVYAAGEVLASVLEDIFSPYQGKNLCICGIGNSQLAEDSLGPNVIRKMSLQPLSYIPPNLCHFQEVYGAIPEVAYYTNFPTEKTVSGITGAMQADCILLIDSLITEDYGNLYRTIQLSTGSGLSHVLTQSSPNWELANSSIISMGIPMGIRASAGFSTALKTDILISSHIFEVLEKASTIIAYALVRSCWPKLTPEAAFDLLSPQIKLRLSMDIEDDGCPVS